MEYKTPFIAKKLGVSPKAVVRIAQQLNLTIEKNKYGHFIFTQEDLDQMLEFHLLQIEQSQNSHPTQKTSSNDVEELKTQVNTIVQNKSSHEFEQLAAQLNTITRRLDRMEEQMQDKANDVVTYQLLQHRREMEEMLERIQKLEASLKKEEPIYITPDSKPTYEREKKPKRRKMIFSIFGL
ncbi:MULTISPECIES: chromosome-anchoring protein RacA [Bacillus]|uniref:Chromosome-anchoring protein RacA n=2 Tax=Bacillus cereus group TaxID=86661 RepID=A0A1A9PLM2_9BACI|nr:MULTISPECIES: chromosome-anchoring protein RacA [Bacillus]OUB89140.1 chromosome segregation protein [Bacillus thuringiensis serovar sinensis]HDR6317015.1 chromosome-anchoring protein RacA [Bacillus thuringiensis]KAA0793712.1 chromosome-anchoring protein RacA [Bacillus sp. BPN334]MBG9831387.1 chromosome segregation protein [Bacillus wiedmannii]MBY7112821.1 chromosome-anchoring protein RacA [Bacillus sp. 17RED48]